MIKIFLMGVGVVDGVGGSSEKHLKWGEGFYRTEMVGGGGHQRIFYLFQ